MACEFDGIDPVAVATAIRLALRIIEEGERLLLIHDPWDPDLYDGVKMTARLQGRTVKVWLSYEQLDVEIVDRSRKSPIRMTIHEEYPQIRIYLSNYIVRDIISHLQEWLEAVDKTVKWSNTLSREASIKRVERIATTAAYAFGAAFKAVELFPPSGGLSLRLRIYVQDWSIDFVDDASIVSQRGAITPTLSRLLLSDPIWTHWRVKNFGMDQGGRCTLVNIERPRLMMVDEPKPDAVAILRRIADNLPPEARLLWQGSQSAPAGLLG